MAKHTIATIQDKNGDVHTGKVVNTDTPATDLLFDVLTAGVGTLTHLAPSSDVTVEYNGERHSGERIK